MQHHNLTFTFNLLLFFFKLCTKYKVYEYMILLVKGKTLTIRPKESDISIFMTYLNITVKYLSMNHILLEL